MLLLKPIQSLHQPKPMITSTTIMIITTTTTITKNKSSDNNNKKKLTNTKKNNNGNNEQAIYIEKLQAQLQEIWKEKYTNFLNLKNYEEQADQTDLPQRNKATEFINSIQITSKVADVKWPKGTAAIVGDLIMSGIRGKLLKIDKYNVKVRFF